MITAEKVKIYKEYLGDIDAFTIHGNIQKKGIISEEDWYLIDVLIQDISLQDKKLLGQNLENNLIRILKDKVDNLETEKLLRDLATKGF